MFATRDVQIDRSDIDTSSSSGFGVLSGGLFGRAGTVFLDAGGDASFFLTDFDTSTIDGSAGPSGGVTIQANNDLSFRFSTIDSSTDSPFQEGDIAFTVGQDAVLEFAILETGSTAQVGRGSNVAMSANILTVDPSIIETSSTSDRAGNVTIDVDTYRQIDGSVIRARMFASGRAGDINITATTSAEVRGGAGGAQAVLDASVAQGEGLPPPDGDAGSISIMTPDLTLDNAALLTLTGGIGQGGSIEIEGYRFVAQNGTALVSASLGSGPGGSVSIDTTESIVFSGESRIENSSAGDGDAGSVLLRSGTVMLTGEALITANVEGAGAGGFKPGCLGAQPGNVRLTVH